MAYEPLVYRTSGGDEQVVSTGGRLLISGTLQLTSGATLTLAGQAVQSSGTATFTGSVNVTSGITASSAAITNGITGSSLAITNGITGSSLAITNGITGSSLAITNGITGSSGTFTNGITGSSGTFTGKVAVSGSLTASSGFIRAFENMATGTSALSAYGVSVVWSSAPGSTSGHRWDLAASTQAGTEKWLVCSASTQTGPAYVSTTGSTVLIDNAIGGIIFSTGSVNRQWVHLLAENTTNWIILSRSTDFLTSTT